MKKKVIKQLLNEGLKQIIKKKKLAEMAKGIELICNGEYGYTFYHPEKNKIFICLGDANPFDDEYLKEWVLDAISDWDNRDKIDIEIEHESTVPEDEGWLQYDNDEFKPW
jgi:hypothetical protein